MTQAEWHLLEKLCRKALDEYLSTIGQHAEVAKAFATAGAFAAAVGDNIARNQEHQT